MDAGAGIQVTGGIPASLTLDRASLITTFGSSVDASLLSSLDISVTNSSLLQREWAIYVDCRKHLNIRIVNSTLESLRNDLVYIRGNMTRMTLTAELSSFIGRVQMNGFSADLIQLVRFSD